MDRGLAPIAKLRYVDCTAAGAEEDLTYVRPFGLFLIFILFIKRGHRGTCAAADRRKCGRRRWCCGKPSARSCYAFFRRGTERVCRPPSHTLAACPFPSFTTRLDPTQAHPLHPRPLLCPCRGATLPTIGDSTNNAIFLPETHSFRQDNVAEWLRR